MIAELKWNLAMERSILGLLMNESVGKVMLQKENIHYVILLLQLYEGESELLA